MKIVLEQKVITVSKRTVSRTMSERGLLFTKRIPHGITKATTAEQEEEKLVKRDFWRVNHCRRLFQILLESSVMMESCIIQQ